MLQHGPGQGQGHWQASKTEASRGTRDSKQMALKELTPSSQPESDFSTRRAWVILSGRLPWFLLIAAA